MQMEFAVANRDRTSPPGFAILIFVLISVTSMTVNAEDPAIDRLLASQCAQCHGTDGHAVGDMDGLAGAEFRDLYDKLLDFRRKDDHDVMHYQIQGYTRNQLSRIASYYANLPGEDGDD